MTTQKIRQYLTLICKIPIPITISHKIVKENLKNIVVMQPLLVLLIFSISVPNLVTIGRHLTSFLTCATFNMLHTYSR